MHALHAGTLQCSMMPQDRASTPQERASTPSSSDTQQQDHNESIAGDRPTGRATKKSLTHLVALAICGGSGCTLGMALGLLGWHYMGGREAVFAVIGEATNFLPSDSSSVAPPPADDVRPPPPPIPQAVIAKVPPPVDPRVAT